MEGFFSVQLFHNTILLFSYHYWMQWNQVSHLFTSHTTCLDDFQIKIPFSAVISESLFIIMHRSNKQKDFFPLLSMFIRHWNAQQIFWDIAQERRKKSYCVSDPFGFKQTDQNIPIPPQELSQCARQRDTQEKTQGLLTKSKN